MDMEGVGTDGVVLQRELSHGDICARFGADDMTSRTSSATTICASSSSAAFCTFQKAMHKVTQRCCSAEGQLRMLSEGSCPYVQEAAPPSLPVFVSSPRIQVSHSFDPRREVDALRHDHARLELKLRKKVLLLERKVLLEKLARNVHGLMRQSSSHARNSVKLDPEVLGMFFQSFQDLDKASAPPASQCDPCEMCVLPVLQRSCASY